MFPVELTLSLYISQLRKKKKSSLCILNNVQADLAVNFWQIALILMAFT